MNYLRQIGVVVSVMVLASVAVWGQGRSTAVRPGRSTTQPVKAPAGGKAESFDPPVEYFINSNEQDILFVDFDTGATGHPPADVLAPGSTRNSVQMAQPRMRAWALANGFDAAVYIAGIGQALELDALSIAVNDSRSDALYSDKIPRSVNAWDILTPAQVRQGAASRGPWEGTFLTAGSRVALTYPFMTRQGAMGLVQLMANADRPGGGKAFLFRYKIVHGTATTQPAAPVATRPAGSPDR